MNKVIISVLFFFLASCVSTDSKVQRQFNLELVDNKINSIQILKEKNYAALNKYFEELSTNFLNDISFENKLEWELDSISQTKENLKASLDSFIKSSPNSYLPYTLRAIYFSNLSWRNRGGHFIDKVTKEEIDSFLFYKALALEDIDKAIEIENGYSWLYRYKRLILIGQKGVGESKNLAFNKAFELRPESFMLWNDLLHNSTRRWGGSITKMEEIIERSARYGHLNPKLKELSASIPREQGDQAFFLKDYHAAEKLYLKSISIGDHSWARYRLASIYFEQRKNTEGCKQIYKGLELRPTQWLLNSDAKWCRDNGLALSSL